MSRLAKDLDLEPATAVNDFQLPRFDPKKFKLSRNRKRPLHPEAVEDLLRERAKMASPPPGSGWMWPYGWLLILWDQGGTRHFSDLPPGMSYQEAAEIRDASMATGDYEKAWLIQKSARKEK